jgi:hypothetical protein
MSFADQVFLVLGQALSSAHLRYTPDRSLGHVTSVQASSGAPLSLLEYLTMNPRPEIRGQEALLPYLVAAGFHVTRECRMHIQGKRRIFDFVVRPSGTRNNDTDPDADNFVVVELKHLGAQQTGGFGALLGPVVTPARKALSTLHSDFHKRRPAVPMIQVGLFTAIDGWSQAGASVHWSAVDSPFVKRYVKSKTLGPNYQALAMSTLSTWSLNNRYTRPASWPATSHFNVGPKVDYDTPAGIRVIGRVHYFLGITQHQIAASLAESNELRVAS